MGLFNKIKKWFSKEDQSPLPSTDEFFSDSSFDPEKFLREMEQSSAEHKSSPKDSDSHHNPLKSNPKKDKKSDIASLFISEGDKIDPEQVKRSSQLDRELNEERTGGPSHSSSDSSKSRNPLDSPELRENIQRAKDSVKETGEKIRSGFDSFLNEVEKKSAELDDIERAEKERYSGPLNYRGNSLLDDKDDFFEKARAFADGRPLPSDKAEIIDSDRLKSNKKKDDRKVYGFEDADGDGDEIIDDAIIEEE